MSFAGFACGILLSDKSKVVNRRGVNSCKSWCKEMILLESKMDKHGNCIEASCTVYMLKSQFENLVKAKSRQTHATSYLMESRKLSVASKSFKTYYYKIKGKPVQSPTVPNKQRRYCTSPRVDSLLYWGQPELEQWPQLMRGRTGHTTKAIQTTSNYTSSSRHHKSRPTKH